MRTFRIFVSSTFGDLENERNRLQESVFPRLRRLCRSRGARFQAIDLRWGVSGEATRDQQAMNICLGEIERCRRTIPRPNFLILLGQRRGWLPPPNLIPADEYVQLYGLANDPDNQRLLDKWYRLDENAVPQEYRLLPRWPGSGYSDKRAWGPVEARLQSILSAASLESGLDENQRRRYVGSATEQEIAAGVLQVSELQDGEAFCFLRRIIGAPRDVDGRPSEGAERFIDEDQKYLRALERELIATLPGSIKSYQVPWSEAERRPSTEYLDELEEDVFKALAEAIETELACPTPTFEAQTPAYHGLYPDLDDEGQTHLAFAERLLEVFVGRDLPLATIRDYLTGDSNLPLVVLARGGAGKSALLARSVEEARLAHPKAQLVVRFIGATPGSSDIRALLASLCSELARRYKRQLETFSDYRELVPEFRRRLGFATADQPLIFFLDGLDQLSAAQVFNELSWLPEVLPAHAKLVLSSRPMELIEGRRFERLELVGLSRFEGDEILDSLLARAGRTLQATQREEVLRMFRDSGGLPLYLRLAFEEVRRWTSWEKPGVLASSVEGILREQLFTRLADRSNHGPAMVSTALGYLVASRQGLAEDELLDVLSRDPELYASFFHGLYHLPPDLVAWAKDYRWLTKSIDSQAEPPPGQGETGATEEWLEELRNQPTRKAELRRFLEEVLLKSGGPRLPVVMWSRLFFDLEPYLVRRQTDQGTLIAFYHRELEEVAREDYLRGETGRQRHGRLADYFWWRADPKGDGSWTGNEDRGLSELPYHLCGAGRWEDVRHTLTSFSFLQAKVSGLGPQALLDDYDVAASGFEDEDLVLTRDALRLSAPVVGPDPGQLAAQFCGRLGALDNYTTRSLVQKASNWRGAPWLRPVTPSLETAGGPLLDILRGHEGEIAALAATPDGQRLVSASWDNTLKVWNVVSGVELRTLEGHSDLITSLALANDARQVISAARDEQRKGDAIRVWDLETGEMLHNLDAAPLGVNAIAASLDGSRIVSGSWDGTLQIWDPVRRKAVRSWKGHADSVDSLAVTPDGRRFVSASWDRTLAIWDLETGQLLLRLEGHDKGVGSVAVTPDGNRVISGAADNTLKIWDLNTGELLKTLHGHEDNVNAISVFPAGALAASVSVDLTLGVWDLEAGQEVRTLDPVHGDEVTAVAVFPDGRRIATGSLERNIKIWEWTRPDPPMREGHIGRVHQIVVAKDGRRAISCAPDGCRVWDITTGGELLAVAGHGEDKFADWIYGIAVTPDSRRVIPASRDGTLKIWDIESGTLLGTLEGHIGSVDCVVLTPDGYRAISGASDKTLKLWDLKTEKLLRTYEGHNQGITAVAVTPDGSRIVSAAEDEKLRVWDLESGRSIGCLEGYTEGVRTLASTPDGNSIVSGSWDFKSLRTPQIWDLEPGQEAGVLEGHSGIVNAVAVSSEGHLAVSASFDSTLRMWKLDDHSTLAIFTADEALTACAITVDGSTVLAGSDTGALHLLRLEWSAGARP